MHEEMRQAALKASEGEAQLPAGSAKVKKLREDEARAEIEIMKKTLADETLTAKARLQVREELAQKTIALNNMLAGAPGGSKSHQETTDYLAAIRLRVAEADGNSKKIIAIYDEEIAKLKQLVAAHKATMAQVSNAEREKVVEVNKARIQEIDTEAKDFEYKARLLDVNTKLASMAAGTFKYAGQKEGPGADQRTVSSALAEASQIQSFAAHQISELKEIQSTQEAGTRSYKETQDKINSIILDSKTKEEALYKKAGDAAVAAANKQAAAFTDFFDKLGSAFESFGSTMFDALIAPQKEIIKAGLSSKTISDQGSQMRAAVGQLLKSVAESAVKSIGEALSHTLANALTGGASNTIGEMLGKWMSSAVSSIAGNTAGAAAGSAVGQAAGGAVGDTAVVTAITTGATATTTGISGAIATLGATMDATAIASTTSIVSAITAAATAEDVLLAALNVKPSALGFTYASGGIVSAAGGMTVGGVGTQMAILHSQEMVLPAPISRGLQQMIARGQTGGGDSNTSNMANLNYNPTINARPGRGGSGMSRGEFSTMMGLHSGAMLGQARNMMRNGWRPA
jgi:hypothetical protein